MAFETFDLGRVLQTAEAIKGARRQSVVDDLQAQYLGQRIEAGKQEMDANKRAQEITLGKEKAQQHYTQASYVLQSQNPKNFVEQNFPDFVKEAQGHGIQWESLTDDQVKQMAQGIMAKAGAELGQGPVAPITSQDVGGATVITQGGQFKGMIGSKEQGGFSLNPGETRYGPDGKVIARAPAATPKAPEPPSGYRWKADGSGLEAVPGGPADPKNPKNDRADIKVAQALRKEFEGLDNVKNYRSVLPLYQRASTAPNTRAGDLSVVYALGKMFDPGSVVREGELKLSKDAQPWLRKVVSEANSQLTGRGAIDPQTRGAILEAMRGQVEAFQQPFTQERQRYSQYANEGGFTPEQIVGPDPSAAFPKPKQSGPVQISSDADYANLPSGAQYIAPDGSTRTKR